jgi:pSer/pThr/pTyr-binding forkhead associated (FHA) protein
MDYAGATLEAPVITVQIIHIDGPRKGEIDEFEQDRITIGRDPHCDVVFPKDMRIVSRVHAEIVREGNRYLFINKSKNGSYMNSQAIDQVFLKQGDVIAITEGGPKISFLSKINKTAAARQRPIAPRTPQPPTPPGGAYTPPQPPGQGANYGAGGTGVAPPIQKPQTPEVAPYTFQFGIQIKSLKQATVKLGRSESNDFSLPHPNVYDSHAEIFFSVNAYFIRDMTNNHATFVNGRAIQSDTMLADNDVIMFGENGPQLRYLGTGRFVEVIDQAAAEEQPEETEFAASQADEVESHKAFTNVQPAHKKKGLFKSLFKNKFH